MQFFKEICPVLLFSFVIFSGNEISGVLKLGRTVLKPSEFEKLYMKYRNVMYSVAFGILQNEQDAEDAVQNAFMYVFQHPEKIRSIESPKTKGFLIIVSESKAIDIYRSRKARHEVMDDEILEKLISEEGISAHELASYIVKLPKRYREVIILHFYYGFSITEIAKMQSATYEGVRKLLSRTKNKLRKMIEEDI